MEHIFTQIYEQSVWGPFESSGFGSSVEYNREYISFLQNFIRNNNINTVVDLGCGDFLCGPFIYNKLKLVKYTGYDVYKKHIDNNNDFWGNDIVQFIHLDFYKAVQDILAADLCIIKDVLQHWSNQKIYTFLDSLIATKKFKFILIINCSYQTIDEIDINDGEFRPLNANMYPLLKYNCQTIFSYNTKQINLITPTC